MKSFAVVSLFATLALAQSSAIPSGISAACTTFMNQLNADPSLKSCTNSLTSATQAFGPGGSGSASNSSVTSALGTLCGDSSSCSQTTVRSQLASFYSACTPELTSSLNKDVQEIYDVLYVILPLRDATCTKDDSGNYCASEIAASAPAASSLFTSSQQVVTPNFDTLESSNAAFLFLKPDLSSDKLCTTCTRNIMTSYISYESNIAYAPGLSQSILLNGQTPLYQAIQNTCGANFLSGAVQAAGTLSGGIIGNAKSGAAPRAGASAGGIAALLGAVSVAVAML